MKLGVIIPCFREKQHILDVIKKIPESVSFILIVDDCCPEKTGEFVKENSTDSRVEVIVHDKNQGVGGALKTGYRHSIENGWEIAVKIDGDGQMNPLLIPYLVDPILRGEADYVKGNRFSQPEHLEQMPKLRLFGNAGLSFVSKFVSGYWNIMDPTNGFTGIHRQALKTIPLDKVSNSYFFESDMLFRLGLSRSVVCDRPHPAFYGDETSSMSILNVLFEFPSRFVKRIFKRIFYLYFLRDFNWASLSLVLGTLLCVFASLYGGYHWTVGQITGVPTATGVIMLATLPMIIGFQLLLFFLQYDLSNIPKKPLQGQGQFYVDLS